MKPAHLILLILMNVLWAGTYAAAKWLAPELTAGEVVTLRFALAGAGLLAAWPWLPGRAPTGGDALRAVAMGIVVFSLGYHLQVAGIYMGRAGDVSILMALDPIFSSLGATLFLGERIERRTWAGFACGMLGVCLIAGAWRSEFRWPALVSNLLVVGSLVCEAAYSAIGKGLAQRAGPLKILALAVAGGAAVNLAIDGNRTWHAAVGLPWTAWLVMGYLALICTVAGYALWLVVIKETPVSLTALTIFIQPVAGVIIAALWLGEAVHWRQLWGGLAIFVGLWISRRRLATVTGGPLELG